MIWRRASIDTTVGVIKAIDCILPNTLIDAQQDATSKEKESVLGEYINLHAVLNAWEFGEGQGFPLDTSVSKHYTITSLKSDVAICHLVV